MKFTYKRAAIALGVALPLCAAAAYFALGNSRSPVPEPPPKLLGAKPDGSRPATLPYAGSNPHEGSNAPTMEARIEALAQRLEKEPQQNLQSWITLARSYFLQGRFAQAASAYAEAVKKSPNDPNLLVDYAEALALAQGRSLQGEPEKAIQRALGIDPKHVKGLGMAGRAAFDRAEYALALERWNKLLPLIAPESGYARTLRASMADARARMSAGNAGALSATAFPAVKTAAPGRDASRKTEESGRQTPARQ